MDVLLEQHEMDVPSAMVDDEAKRMMEETKQNMQQQGAAQPGFELPIDLFKEQAERRVKLGMLVSEIMSQNSLTPSDERIRETVELYASSYEKPEEVIEWYYGSPERLDPVKNLVLEDQVYDLLREEMQVENKTSSFDELSA